MQSTHAAMYDLIKAVETYRRDNKAAREARQLSALVQIESDISRAIQKAKLHLAFEAERNK